MVALLINLLQIDIENSALSAQNAYCK